MKITKRDLGVLMILVGFFVAFLTYQMYFKKNQTAIEDLDAETEAINRQIKELEPLKINEKKYRETPPKLAEDVKKRIAEFPADFKYEDGIMYIVDIEDFERDEDAERGKVELAEDDFTNIGFSQLTVSEAEAANTVEGSGNEFAGQTFTYGASTMQVTYTSDYSNIKRLIDHIYSTENHHDILNEITMQYDQETGVITGTATIIVYTIQDGVNQVYEAVELSEDEDDYGLEENEDGIFGNRIPPAKDEDK